MRTCLAFASQCIVACGAPAWRSTGVHPPFVCTRPSITRSAAHPPLAQASSPSGIKPFEKIYGLGPTLVSVEEKAGLVYSPSSGVFCAVEAPNRSVECLLYCDSQCSTKDHLGCPA